jgi:hypothetical protein
MFVRAERMRRKISRFTPNNGPLTATHLSREVAGMAKSQKRETLLQAATHVLESGDIYFA